MHGFIFHWIYFFVTKNNNVYKNKYINILSVKTTSDSYTIFVTFNEENRRHND